MISSIRRRQFLTNASLIALSPTVPGFLRQTAGAAEAKRAGRILVVVQLGGGNDGINTVVPYADEGYAEHRRELRLSKNRLIQVDDSVGLHPSMRAAADLLERGQLAIVQGVGYPNPNRSHDVSMAIWQTARFDPTEHNSFGWLGSAMETHPLPADGCPHAILLGDENPPIALRGRRCTSISLAHLGDLKLRGRGLPEPELLGQSNSDDLLAFTRRASANAHVAAELIDEVTSKVAAGGVPYPQTRLANRLKSIAQLIKADFSTPVYYAIQPGYDTHSAQLPVHARLLRELSEALDAFQQDLGAAGLDDRVLTLCFSEFGRRVDENASFGTDHGTAGPVFLVGSQAKAGLVGSAPSLVELVGGDLAMQVDFRQVYASLLQDWLSVPPFQTLGGEFTPLPILDQG